MSRSQNLLREEKKSFFPEKEKKNGQKTIIHIVEIVELYLFLIQRFD
jgi:hypothetical protein